MEYLVGGVIINDNVTNSANISTGCLAVIMSFDPDCAHPVANFNLWSYVADDIMLNAIISPTFNPSFSTNLVLGRFFPPLSNACTLGNYCMNIIILSWTP